MIQEDDIESSWFQSTISLLLKEKLSVSLKELSGALASWEAESTTTLDAHGAVLKHAARSEQWIDRLSHVDTENAPTFLRDAHDCGLVTKQQFKQWVGVEPEQIKPSPAFATNRSEDKKAYISELLESGPVLVYINASHSGADVPPKYAKDEELILRFGFSLTPAIVDMDITYEALSGTLTFGGVPRRCRLEWKSIFAVVAESQKDGRVWPEDVPANVMDRWQNNDGDGPVPQGDKSPYLESVQMGSAAKAKRGGHLRLVD